MRLSYSSLEKLHVCERLFELDKLLSQERRDDENINFIFGHAYEEGACSYLLHQDADLAIFKAWLKFKDDIEDDKKSLPHLICALQASFFKIDDLLMDYEVVSDIQAIQLGFRLDLNEDGSDYYVGFMDIVLKHKFSGELYVLDCKSTASNLLDLTPMFKNSSQVIGYSIVLDSIASSPQRNFGLLYLVAQLGKDFTPRIHVMPFQKTLNNRLEWFLTLKMDYARILEMKKLGIFPKRGGSCVRFNKPCVHFGTCNLTSFDKPVTELPDENEYHYHFKLDDLIQQHLALLTEGDSE